MESNKKVIYIIEDDISINHGIELTLGTGFEYRHYYSLKEVEKIELADLIILDINLPDGNGFDYLKKIREKYDTPVMIRTTTRLAHSQCLVNLEERQNIEDKPYEKNIQKNVMMPGMAKARHLVVEQRLKDLAEDGYSLDLNKVTYNDTKIGVITSGIPYQYVKEALPNASVLKLGLVHPLPRKLIEDFAKKVDTLYIVEELEPLIEEQVKSWGIACHGKDILTVQGEYSANMLEKYDFSLQDIYRSLEVIAKEKDFIQSEIYQQSKKMGKRNDKILYYDCTNYYFEIENERGMAK